MTDNDEIHVKYAILVFNFILVGYIQLDCCDPSPFILPFNLLNENPTRFIKTNTLLNTTQCNNNGVYEKIETWDTTQSQHHSTCLGECCSIYGILFVDCVAKIVSINNMKIEYIMYEYHNSKCTSPESMLNIDQALILY